MNKMSSMLSISDYRVWVNLGVSEEEKANPQCVSLGFDFELAAPPAATSTDHLEDTLCYGEVVKAAQAFIQGKRFNTIEYLGAGLFSAVSKVLNGRDVAALTLTVHKLSPPVPDLHGGATFTLSGVPERA